MQAQANGADALSQSTALASMLLALCAMFLLQTFAGILSLAALRFDEATKLVEVSTVSSTYPEPRLNSYIVRKAYRTQPIELVGHPPSTSSIALTVRAYLVPDLTLPQLKRHA